MRTTPEALLVRGVVLPEAEHRELYLIDGRVSYSPVPNARTVADGWIVPGLIDAHCHVGLDARGGVEDRGEQERQARADRDAGALLLRDCGVPPDTRWIDEREDLPRILRAGRHLARPKRYLRGVGREVEPHQLAEAIAEQARRGDGWVKIVADWIDRGAGDLTAVWPADVLRAAADRAHAEGARITAHTFSEEALPALIAAGFDCLEHGTGLDDDLTAELARRGTALVPTLINIDNFPSIADSATRFPAYAAHMRRLHAGFRNRVRTAFEAGVSIYVGTDAGGNVEHGRAADEIRALHEAGLPAEDALAAGSWKGRSWLGMPSGLDEGAPADLVVYAGDPRENLGVLAQPQRVVLRGRVVA
ncbi:MAG TPA: amidohydrolase family protein [Frankiaceae bacterium]|nr:amidohydrolase family protein [Frankiaceae bacterium]